MRCPQCGKPSEVLETRIRSEYVYRRYECFNNHRFTTREVVVPSREEKRDAKQVA